MPPMQRRRKTLVLTLEQLATLLQPFEEPARLLAITVAMTGLRIGEALALRWKDVDFGKSLIHVREAVYGGNSRYSNWAKLEAILVGTSKDCNSRRIAQKSAGAIGPRTTEARPRRSTRMPYRPHSEQMDPNSKEKRVSVVC